MGKHRLVGDSECQLAADVRSLDAGSRESWILPKLLLCRLSRIVAGRAAKRNEMNQILVGNGTRKYLDSLLGADRDRQPFRQWLWQHDQAEGPLIVAGSLVESSVRSALRGYYGSGDLAIKISSSDVPSSIFGDAAEQLQSVQFSQRLLVGHDDLVTLEMWQEDSAALIVGQLVGFDWRMGATSNKIVQLQITLRFQHLFASTQKVTDAGFELIQE